MKAKLDLEKDDLIKIEKTVQDKNEKEKSIPSNYIKIRLVSDGRIEDIPQYLYFRDFSAGDVLDISMVEDDTKNLCKVLTRMNYDNFDVSLLPSEDVLLIMVTLYGNFISNTFEKEIYLDEDLPEGENEGEIDYVDNKELVEIPISSLKFNYLGKDLDDNMVNDKIHFPITITDKKTGIKAKFKISNLKDVHIATDFCKEYYKGNYDKFVGIKSDFDKISKIQNVEQRELAYNTYLAENNEKCEEYFQFFQEFSLLVSKVVQSLQIVEYNGKPLESLKEKMEVFTNNISEGMWNTYTDFITKFSFGISPDVEVFSQKLNKKIIRRVSFRFEEFVPHSERKINNNYDISFD